MCKTDEDANENIKSFIAGEVNTDFFTGAYISDYVHIVGNDELRKLENMKIYKNQLEYIKKRNNSRTKKQDKFAVIYEIFIRHYGATGNTLETIGKLKYITYNRLEFLKNMGITHIWLMGLLDTNVYPYIIHGKKPQWIKGDIGSPYSIFNNRKIDRLYLDENDSGFDEFKRLVADASKLGLSIMIDLVPAHTAWTVENDRWIRNPDFEFIPFRKNGRNHYVGQYLLPSHGGIGNFRWRDTAEIDFSYNDIHDPNSVYCIFDMIVAFWQKLGVKGFRTDVSDGCPESFWKYIIANAKQRDKDVFFLCEALSSYGDGLSFLGELDCFDAVYNYPYYHIVRNIAKGCWAQDLYKYPFDYDLKDFFNNDHLTYFQSHHDTNRIMSDQYSFYSAMNEEEKIKIGLCNFVHTVLRSNGQIMLYNGDEIGDAGNQDGMSPLKGFYSYKTGFEQLKSNHESKEAKIFNVYSYILNYSHKKIIRKGEYLNLFEDNSAAKDDCDRIFYNHYIDIFLRFFNKSIILVVTNFSKYSETISFDLRKIKKLLGVDFINGILLKDTSVDINNRIDIVIPDLLLKNSINRDMMITINTPTFNLMPHMVKIYEVNKY
jgi:glycosidase